MPRIGSDTCSKSLLDESREKSLCSWQRMRSDRLSRICGLPSICVVVALLLSTCIASASLLSSTASSNPEAASLGQCKNAQCYCGPLHAGVLCNKNEWCTYSPTIGAHDCVASECSLDVQLGSQTDLCSCFDTPCGLGSTCDSASQQCVCGYNGISIAPYGQNQTVAGAIGASTDNTWHVCACGGGPPFASISGDLSAYSYAANRHWTYCSGGGSEATCKVSTSHATAGAAASALQGGFTTTQVPLVTGFCSSPVCGDASCTSGSDCLCPPDQNCVITADMVGHRDNGICLSKCAINDAVSVSMPCSCNGVRTDIGYTCTAKGPVPLSPIIPKCNLNGISDTVCNCTLTVNSISTTLTISPDWFCPSDSIIVPAPACGAPSCAGTDASSCLCAQGYTCVSATTPGLIPAQPYGVDHGVCLPPCTPNSVTSSSCFCNKKLVLNAGTYCSPLGDARPACGSPDCTSTSLLFNASNPFHINLCGCNAGTCAVGMQGQSPFGECLPPCNTDIIITGSTCACNGKETPANYICPSTGGDAMPACTTTTCTSPAGCLCTSTTDVCTPPPVGSSLTSNTCQAACATDGNMATKDCNCDGRLAVGGSVCHASGGAAFAPCDSNCNDPGVCFCSDSSQVCVALNATLPMAGSTCTTACGPGTVLNQCACGTGSVCAPGSLCQKGACLPPCDIGAWNTGAEACNCGGSPALSGYFCASENVVQAQCGTTACNGTVSNCACANLHMSCVGAAGGGPTQGICLPWCGEHPSTVPAGASCQCGDQKCNAGHICSGNQCYPPCSEGSSTNCNCFGSFIGSGNCTASISQPTCGNSTTCTNPADCACASGTCAFSSLSGNATTCACSDSSKSGCACQGNLLQDGYMCPSDGSPVTKVCGQKACLAPFVDCQCTDSTQACIEKSGNVNGVCLKTCPDGLVGDTCACGCTYF
ncbi:hypothetical protein BC830DRAFT_628583 [Chytriomyces sp. MP71]|nr:hypothetical protein BC830DRAFT_628583 [Chytriomyces sp. MP71]